MVLQQIRYVLLLVGAVLPGGYMKPVDDGELMMTGSFINSRNG